MNLLNLRIIVPTALLALAALSATDAPMTLQTPKHELLAALVGKWQGDSKTWSAGRLLDESKVTGEYTPLMGGRLLRHSYRGQMRGKPRTGEETIAFDRVASKFQIVWFDDFHMNHAMMFSEGKKTDKGFTVAGSYQMVAGQKPWGWRTEYELIDKDHVTITAFNVMPGGREEKAVETVYTRVAGKSADQSK